MEKLRRRWNHFFGREFYLEFEITHNQDGIFGWIIVYRLGLMFTNIPFATDDTCIYEMKHLFHKRYVTQDKLDKLEDYINLRYNEL